MIKGCDGSKKTNIDWGNWKPLTIGQRCSGIVVTIHTWLFLSFKFGSQPQMYKLSLKNSCS